MTSATQTTNYQTTSYPPGTLLRYGPSGIVFRYRFSVSSHGRVWHHGNVVDAGTSGWAVSAPIALEAERCEMVGG